MTLPAPVRSLPAPVRPLSHPVRHSGRVRRLVVLLVGAALAVIGGTTTMPAAATPTPESVAAQPVVFILDASGSMVRETSPGVTRMDEAKEAMRRTIARLPDAARIGLLVFGTGTGNSAAEQSAGCADVKTATRLGPLDRDAVTLAVDALTPSGFTPIGPSMREAAAQLPQGEAGRIVLISDGVDTCSPPPACQTASELRAANPLLTIDVVGFAVDDDEAAQQQLQCIGGVGGGTYVRAANADQLAARLAIAAAPDSVGDATDANGYREARLGMSLDEVLAAVPGAKVAERRTDGGVEYVFVECEWARIELDDDRVVSITPTNGSGTAEGLSPGDPIENAKTLYGEQVDAGTDTNGQSRIFAAAPGSAVGYRIYVTGSTIERIVVCLCVPPEYIDSSPANWEATFDGIGPLRLGATVTDVLAIAPEAVAPEPDDWFWDIPETSAHPALTIELTQDARVSKIAVGNLYAQSPEEVGTGGRMPHARGVRMGDTGLTATYGFGGGTFFEIWLGGSTYTVADRRGRLLSFALTRDTDDLAAATIAAISVEDAALRDFWYAEAPVDDPVVSDEPTTGTASALVRVDPWNDPSVSVPSTSEGAVSECNRDDYRSDRISCSAGARCFLSPDETRALCPRDALADWYLVDVSEALDAATVASGQPWPIALELSDGRRCAFSSGAGPTPPEGFGGWAGACALPGGSFTDVLWSGPEIDGYEAFQPQLFLTPDASGTLRVAVGPEGEAPVAVDVTTVYY